MDNVGLMNDGNFTVDQNVNGPLLATAVAIQFTITLIVNLFIAIFTLGHIKILKVPSHIFLTNFVVNNLMIALINMPSNIITAANGEWIYGNTIKEKTASCQLMGFVFSCFCCVTIVTLAIISIDRFLFIVKPLFYRKFLNTPVAVTIIVGVWIISALVCVPPLFGFGSTYEFDAYSAGCAISWTADRGYITMTLILAAGCIATVVVTTLWTFFYAKKFIQKLDNNVDDERSIHNKRIGKLVGIFGILLVVTLLSYAPLFIAGVIGIIIGFEKVPRELNFLTITFIYLTPVLNPIIQSYFRRELSNSINSMYWTVCNFCYTYLMP